MINEAIDIENEENGTTIEPVTRNLVGRMLSEVGIEKMAEKLQETVVESTQSAEKNV